jgi:Flp pilus assembly protein TadD
VVLGRRACGSGAGDLPAGLTVAREGVETWPAHSVLRNNLAVLLEAAGEAAEAEQVLRAALADDATLPQLSKNLGDLLYRAGRFEEAQEAAPPNWRLGRRRSVLQAGQPRVQAARPRTRSRLLAAGRHANPAHQLARANLEILDVPA